MNSIGSLLRDALTHRPDELAVHYGLKRRVARFRPVHLCGVMILFMGLMGFMWVIRQFVNPSHHSPAARRAPSAKGRDAAPPSAPSGFQAFLAAGSTDVPRPSSPPHLMDSRITLVGLLCKRVPELCGYEYLSTASALEHGWPLFLNCLIAQAAGGSLWPAIRTALEEYASDVERSDELISWLPVRLAWALPLLRDRILLRLHSDREFLVRVANERVLAEDNSQIARQVQEHLPILLASSDPAVRGSALAYLAFSPVTLRVEDAKAFVQSSDDFRSVLPVLLSDRRKHDRQLAEWFAFRVRHDLCCSENVEALRGAIARLAEWDSPETLAVVQYALQVGPPGALSPSNVAALLTASGPPDTPATCEWLLMQVYSQPVRCAAVYLSALESLRTNRIRDEERVALLGSSSPDVRAFAVRNVSVANEVRRLAQWDSDTGVRLEAMSRLAEIGLRAEAASLLMAFIRTNPPIQERQCAFARVSRVCDQHEIDAFLQSYSETDADAQGKRLVEFLLQNR